MYVSDDREAQIRAAEAAAAKALGMNPNTADVHVTYVYWRGPKAR